jgi:hypothetical protein
MVSAFSLIILTSTTSLAEHFLPSTAYESKAVLGKGYDTKKEQFVGDCVTGDVEYVGAQESSINFERSLSQEETSNMFGFSVGGKARYGMISGSASAKFARESQADSYSESTVYMALYNFKNAKLKFTGPTPIGTRAMGGNTHTWERWEQTCGHEFVEQIKLGAKIFISAKIDFATKEDKQSFSAQFNIKGPAFSASSELKKASKFFGKTAAISIRAYQLGGDVSRLSSIFSKHSAASIQNGATPVGPQIHSLLTCSFDKMDACLELLDTALSYASNTNDPNAFPNQIRPDAPLGTASGPAHLAYITKDWTDLAYYAPNPLLAAAVKAAREDLSLFFEQQMENRNRIQALKAAPFRLSASQQKAIDRQSQIVTSNIKNIVDTALVCYEQASHCIDEFSLLGQKLKPINEDDLQIRFEMFSQYCDAVTAGKLSFKKRHTISSILKEVALQHDLSIYPDQCGMIEVILKEQNTIDLRGLSLEDLQPLSTLTHFEELDLSSNLISPRVLESLHLERFDRLKKLWLNTNNLVQLSEVSKAKMLTHLYLGNNGIRDLSPLSSLINLQLLNLGDNSIDNVQALGPLRELRHLMLNNNLLTEVTPLISLQRLEALDVSHNRIHNWGPLSSMIGLKRVKLSGNLTACPNSLLSMCEVMEE